MIIINFNKRKKLLNLVFIVFILSSIFLSTFNNSQCQISLNSKDDILSVSDTFVGAYFVPGVSGSISPDQIIKIGHLNDMDHEAGTNSRDGALLAAREINEAGGVIINSSQYYVGFVSEDTGELNTTFEYSKCLTAVNNMINIHDPHFIIGGSSTWFYSLYIENLMDAQKIFINTGGETNIPGTYVQDPVRYQYFFKLTPNVTETGYFSVVNLIAFAHYLNDSIPSHEIDTIGILYNSTNWNSFRTSIELACIEYGLNVVHKEFDNATLEGMNDALTSLEADGCDIVLPLILYDGASEMMTQSYSNLKPNFLLMGLWASSAFESYWDKTEGKCEYQIVFQQFHGTNLTARTIPFWEEFQAEYEYEPYYTATSSYDAVYMLVNASVSTQSFNSTDIIPFLEGFTPNNPFTGASGLLGFENHTVLHGYPYPTFLMCQWQSEGNRVVIPSYSEWSNYSYSDDLTTGSLQLPPWVEKAWGITDNTPDIDPISITIIIIIVLSVIGVSILSTYHFISRRKKKSSVKKEFRYGDSITDHKKPKAITDTFEFQRDKVDLEPIPSVSKPIEREIRAEEKHVELTEVLDRCIVHKGIITGISYTCPKCHAKYCIKCYKILSEKKESCWVCNTEPMRFEDELFDIQARNDQILGAEEIVEMLDQENPLDLLLEKNIKFLEWDFWEKIEALDLSENDKEEFARNMMSLSEEDRKKIIDGMMKLQTSGDSNPIL